MGEHFVKVDLSELRYVTFYCPSCGTGLKFDMETMPSLVGCACGRTFPQNERQIIGDLAESYQMYAKVANKFKVEFEIRT